MRGRRLIFGLITTSIYLISVAWLVAAAHAQTPPENSLKKILQNYFKSPFSQEYKTTRYYPVFANLESSQPRQVIVYVTGPHWCGTGGCTLVILTPTPSGYQVISQTIGVQLPVQILTTMTAGWHDISVASQEGPRFLPFNGRRYPINAYSFPSRHFSGDTPGEVVISPAAKGVPLYD